MNILRAEKYVDNVKGDAERRTFDIPTNGLYSYHAGLDPQAIKLAGITEYFASGGTTTERDDWKCHAWRCHLTTDKGSHTFDYYQGKGHVAHLVGGNWKHGPSPVNSRWGHREAPYAPGVADFLHSLCLDAQSATEPFDWWCDSLGYDSDSIKAFKTYQACCEIRQKLTTLGIDYAKVAELLQDL